MFGSDFNNEIVRKGWKDRFKTKLWKAPGCWLPFIKYRFKRI